MIIKEKLETTIYSEVLQASKAKVIQKILMTIDTISSLFKVSYL